jgi:hypothetical protein
LFSGDAIEKLRQSFCAFWAFNNRRLDRQDKEKLCSLAELEAYLLTTNSSATATNTGQILKDDAETVVGTNLNISIEGRNKSDCLKAPRLFDLNKVSEKRETLLQLLFLWFRKK